MHEHPLATTLLRGYLTVQAACAAAGRRLSRLARPGQAGEGVISVAIAVLIMAALGAVMWIGFQELWGKASSQTDTKLDTIAG